MAKITAHTNRNNMHFAHMEANRAAWLEQEENDAYHAQFDGGNSSDPDEKYYYCRALSTDGELENGIEISVADFW